MAVLLNVASIFVIVASQSYKLLSSEENTLNLSGVEVSLNGIRISSLDTKVLAQTVDIELLYFFSNISFKLRDCDCIDEGHLDLYPLAESIDWKGIGIMDDELVGVDRFTYCNQTIH